MGLAFSPFVGLHLLFVVLIARVFKLNALVLFAGSLVHNPWTMIPIHALGLLTGDFLLDGSISTFELASQLPLKDMSFSMLIDPTFWHQNRDFIHQIIPPFVVGSLFWSACIGVSCYKFTFHILSARAEAKSPK